VRAAVSLGVFVFLLKTTYCQVCGGGWGGGGGGGGGGGATTMQACIGLL